MFSKFVSRFVLPCLLLSAVFVSQTQAAGNFWIDQAKSGNPRAQYNLARMYLWGMPDLGVPQSDTQAYKWFKKAADQGYAPAEYEVGISLIQGRGVHMNPGLGRAWIKKANAKGYFGGKNRASRNAAAGEGDTAIPPGELLSLIGSLSVDSIVYSVTHVRFFSGWWTWWLGSIGLGLVTIGFWYANRVTLGVSSSWDRVVGWREDAKLIEADQMMRATPVNDLAAAMMAETVAEFGDDIPDSMRNSLVSDPSAGALPSRPERTRWTVHVTFLIAFVVGGFLGYVPAGNWQLHMDMGPEFVKLFGNGPEAMVVLLVGGVLIGFGTRLGGGCTSGHGLSGCSRLQIGSIVGTAAFFGTAVVVSILLDLFLT
jgi:hypothetical protein